MATQDTVAENIHFTTPPPKEECQESATEARKLRVAHLAYKLAERRGFGPGHELEDWLAAEREIDGLHGAG